jgi:hypothetical protein
VFSGKLVQTNLDSSAQKTEKDKAFDLLDALSRSGALPIACAELHVMVAATHCFDKSLIGTVIQVRKKPTPIKLSSALSLSLSLSLCVCLPIKLSTTD